MRTAPSTGLEEQELGQKNWKAVKDEEKSPSGEQKVI